MSYNPSNLFARIMRGEVPCKKIYEDAYAFAFYDIAPAAPVHALVVPKGPYCSCDDFADAPVALQCGFWKAVQTVARQLQAADSGYRIVSNHGEDAGQMVPHFHVHILAGRPLGALLQPV